MSTSAPAGTALAGRRLAFVLGSMELGGAERQALQLAAALPAASGAEVAVFAMSASGDGPLRSACAAAGLACTALPRCESRWAWRCAWRCRAAGRAMRAFRPHLLLPYTAPANLAAALGLRASGAQGLIWNQRDEGLDRPAPRLERRALRQAARFIANSHGGASFLSGLGVPAERIAIIPNAVAIPAARADRAAWRQRLGVDAGDLLACMVAHLNAHKDHATALAAWARVCAALAGRMRRAGARRARRRARAPRCAPRPPASASPTGCASWAPATTSPACTAPATWRCSVRAPKGQPGAVLEAMAAGLPVAGSDIPALRTLLGDGATLAPPGDAAGLATAILALAGDPGRRQHLGAALRQRARDAFGLPALVAASIREISAALAAPQP